MHDFVSYLFYLLQRGMRFAVPAALVCGLILAVCYAVCRKKGRRFPWGKAVCAVLLVGWAAVTAFVTLLRSEPNEFAARQCNLQLFLAWREAYQRFTLQIWLNVLLNIALFVPLGFLLPLLAKPFRKWYAALGAGFGVSLLIELAQFFTGRGMCDVDDLFTNTLGAMLGWCAAMLVLALHQKSRTWPRYCALPAAFALTLSAIFISYAAQPYGNLRDASVTTADLSGVRWSVDYALDEDSKTAWVYRSQALDNVGADRFAAEFAAAHGVEFPDAYYYDDLVIYANHSSGDFLDVTLHDGTWEYSFGRDHTPVFDAPASGVTEDMLREELDKFGFFIPADAAFTLSPYGETSYRAVRGLAIRRERERSVGGDEKAKLVELFAQHVLCDTRRGRIENGRVIAPKAVFPRAVVQGDVEEVAGRVVGVDHKVIVVVRIRKFDAVRGGKFRGEAVGAYVVERLRAIDPGGLAVLIECIIDRPADAAQVRRRDGGVAQVAVGLRGVGNENGG